MFYGEYSHSLDGKNRFRLPKQLKNSTEFVITKGNEGCLFVFEKAYFNTTFAKGLESVPTFDVDAQKVLRLFLSSCHEVSEDNQGRLLLPASLKEYAKISKDIVLLGVGNRVEIWAKEKWEKYSASSNFDELSASLKNYSL
ncbi:MAG: division/cell wall cluster transcriptional repressor MraZ [Clostridia bacterium]|nr:division/cell wall cluster transcriptional repressor MraZ [Clostridia bacterium]